MRNAEDGAARLPQVDGMARRSPLEEANLGTHLKWEYQFWSLLATEFYFFDNSWIPDFMYQLWMVELASMYHSAQVRESHRSYLRHYSGNYGRMCDFFDGLQDIAQQSNNDAATRNRKVAEIVDKWKKIHAH